MAKYKEYLYLIIGLLIASLSFNLFLSPFHLAAGGVSGLALFFNTLFNINESLFIFIVNLFLLLLSYIFLGKDQTRKSFLGSLLFPLMISLTSGITNYLNFADLEMIVIAIIGGIMSGIGYGLIFKSGFTSGGTDILNQIMEKYLHISIGTSIIIVDGLITLAGIFIFGLNTMIYALITLILISIYNNKMLLGINSNKTLYIYSEKYFEITKYLHEELKYDSTDFNVQGGYTNKNQKLILTVIPAKDYYKIKLALKLIDPKIFIIVVNSYQQVNANATIRN